MGVRDRLAKIVGVSAPSAQPVSMEAIEASLVQNGMEGRPFNPGQPVRPFDGYDGTPRSRDFQTGYNIASRPRTNERVAFETLRGLVEAYDVAQMCIWHRIDSVRSLDWNLVAKKGYNGDIEKAIEIGHSVLEKPDHESPFTTWLAKYLYDILAFDAGTLFKMRNVAGRAVGLRVIDGTTIAPLLDDWGNRPTGAAPAYVQYAQGVPWEWLTADSIIYQPFRPMSNSVYGKAPLETILLNANTDLRFQRHFLGKFTEGNVPEGFAEAPEGWTPEQIREYQDTWDALLYGDDTQKHQIKWVPNGTKFTWSNTETFTDEFSLFLMRKTAAAYHVTPADLGFTEDVNRASGETQADVQFRVGDLPLIQHIEGILSRFLQHDMGLPISFKFDTGQETEDRVATATHDQIMIRNGVVSPSEIREMRYGLTEPEGQRVPRYIFGERSGPIPLNALYAVAGPIDLESAAPAEGAPLPHKPFAIVEGVAPREDEKTPALAAVEYPEDNQQALAKYEASLAPSAPAPAAGVAKAEGAGIAVSEGTVATGNPMLQDEDDEDKPDHVEKAAEMRAFSNFVKARVRDGRWRDFNFSTLNERQSREANRMGLAKVRKADGEVSVAGLCVRAEDTGRVLMLQRWMDESDPAGGMWEFPGGHLEPGETPVHAAVREWCEETGYQPPADGKITGGWTATNGIYQGVVVTVPSESSVDMPGGEEPYLHNPDDPDGDRVEVCAWWDPAHLNGNPAVRQELQRDLGVVLPQIAPSLATYVAKGSDWDSHSARRIEEPLSARYGTRLRSAMQQSVSKDALRSVVAAYLDNA